MKSVNGDPVPVSHRPSARRTRSRSRTRRPAARPARSRVRALGRSVRRRLEAMDRRWDREETLRIAAPAVAVGGAILGIFVHRAFLIVPAAVAVYEVQKPVRRWLPRILFVARVLRGMRAFRERVRGSFRAAMGY